MKFIIEWENLSFYTTRMDGEIEGGIQAFLNKEFLHIRAYSEGAERTEPLLIPMEELKKAIEIVMENDKTINCNI